MPVYGWRINGNDSSRFCDLTLIGNVCFYVQGERGLQLWPGKASCLGCVGLPLLFGICTIMFFCHVPGLVWSCVGCAGL